MLEKEFELFGKRVGESHAPIVIAEVGSNFNQDLGIAYDLIENAANTNADAVKFQLFRAEELYPPGSELYDLFKKIELTPDWLPKLQAHARKHEIEFLASAFDIESVDILEDLGVTAFKIASSETTNLRLVHHIASTGKPVIISTGMCDSIDVEEAIDVCIGVGNRKVALLQCGAVYPLPKEQVHLRVISSYIERFACPVGFSDHTRGPAAAVAAVGLGARVFEKHLTLSRDMEGPDHFFATEPDELVTYIELVHEAFSALGKGQKQMLPMEKENGRREGLYATRDLAAGEVIGQNDLVEKRPAIGLSSRYRPFLLGAQLIKAVGSGDPIFWDSVTYPRTKRIGQE